MKRSIRNRMALLLGATSLCGGFAAPAWAAEAEEGASGSDIIVTARRVEERLQDVPISITVMQQEDLAKRNIVNAGDLGTYTPSLSTNSRFGAEKTTFAIRGFVQENASGPAVGVYFADAVAPRGAGRTGGGNGAGPGAFFDLQNVQVLKGPQGTLFGRNTTGGAVLLVPKKPTADLEGFIEGTYGNFDQRRVQAVVNVPLADTFRVRLGVDRNLRDGYIKNVGTVGPKSFSDVDYWAFRASMVADLTPDLENYTVATYSKSDTAGSLLVMAASNVSRATCTAPGFVANTLAQQACVQASLRSGKGNYFNGVTDLDKQGLKLRQWQIINTTTWRASDTLTVKNIAAYGHYQERFYLNSFGFNFRNFFSVYPIPGYRNTDQSTFSEELQLQGRSGNGKLNWQAGGYLEISDPLGTIGQFTKQSNGFCQDIQHLQCNPTAGAAGRINVNIPFVETHFRSKALYAQGTYNLTDQFAVTAGIRYTWDKTFGFGAIGTASFNTTATTPTLVTNPTFVCNNLVAGTYVPPTSLGGVLLNCKDAAGVSSKKPTWLISLEYKPVTDVLLYAKYARGYRAGGVDLSVTSGAPYQPEKVESYELGAKTSFDGAVSGYFNVAAFYNDLSKQQLQVSLTYASGLRGSNLVNAGQSVLKGIEVDASITPFEGLKLDAGYTYLSTKLKSYVRPASLVAAVQSGFITAVTGEPAVGGDLLLSPHHKFVGTASYTLPLDESIGKISASATFIYTSSSIASVSDRPTALLLGIPDPGKMPSTNLINLNLNWDSVGGLPVDLAVFATNVTNEKYPVNCGCALSNPGFNFTSHSLAAPRMYGVRLRYTFGK